MNPVDLPAEIYTQLNKDRKALDVAHDGMADKVLIFMEAFHQPIKHDDNEISKDDFKLAFKLMVEEIAEMWQGFDKFRAAPTLENKTEFVDGAIDTIYVVLWSLLKFGVPVDACFNEVQRSNMAKLQPDGTCLKNEAGKVQKPAGWTAPDLHGILQEHQVKGKYKNGLRDHSNDKLIV